MDVSAIKSDDTVVPRAAVDAIARVSGRQQIVSTLLLWQTDSFPRLARVAHISQALLLLSRPFSVYSDHINRAWNMGIAYRPTDLPTEADHGWSQNASSRFVLLLPLYNANAQVELRFSMS